MPILTFESETADVQATRAEVGRHPLFSNSPSNILTKDKKVIVSVESDRFFRPEMIRNHLFGPQSTFAALGFREVTNGHTNGNAVGKDSVNALPDLD